MVTEIVRWCSVHYARDEKVTAQPFSLSADGKLIELDLCGPCWDEYVKPLKALLDEYGAKPDGATVPRRSPASVEPSERRYVCLWCPKAYTSDTGLGLHLRTAHGIQGKARDVWGSVCPVCGQEHGQLGAHTYKEHNGMTVSQALVWARDNGDPAKAFAKAFSKVKKYSGKR